MCRYSLAVMILLLSGPVFAQNIVLQDPPKVFKAKMPPTRREIEQRDSLYLYVEGLQLMRRQHYHEALEKLEQASKLDPDASEPIKDQIPILIHFDRFTDAMNAAKKVVASDPGDYAAWHVLSKLCRMLAKYSDAIDALENSLKAQSLKGHPEAAQQLYYELGGLYEQTEKYSKAADAFHKAAVILEHPDVIAEKAHVPIEAVKARAADTYEKIGQLYRKAKQHNQAIAALVKAQERAPRRSAQLSFSLAVICDEAGRVKDALTHVDAYLRTQPLGIEAYEMKVDLLKKAKQHDAVVPWLEAAAERDQFNNALKFLFARELVGAKDYKKAEAVYKKLADDSPSADAYRGLFRIYQAQGTAGRERVLNIIDTAVAKAAGDVTPAGFSDVQHAKAMLGAVREDGELARGLVDSAFKRPVDGAELKFDTLYLLAVLADKHRKTEEAEKFYRACLKDKKAEGNNEPLLYSGLLRVLMKARKHEAAVDVCQTGLKTAKATNPLLFYSDLARAQAGLHRYDEALKTTEVALKQPGNSELTLKMLRVRILAMAERFKDAETETMALLKKTERPADVIEVRYLLSTVYSTAKRPVDAESQLQMILKIDPDNPTVNNDLGYIWADQSKNLDVAENMIRKALDVDRSLRRRNPNLTADDDRDNAAYVDSLGWVLFRRGKLDEARKELERAAVLDGGEDPVIYDHLGDVYQRLQMHGEAVRAWQRALQLYKDGARGKDEDRTRDLERKIKQAK